jgi:hypothetical protein
MAVFFDDVVIAADFPMKGEAAYEEEFTDR